VTVEKSGATAAITSPSAMLRLGVGHGDAIHLVAQGDEAGEALDAICALIESGMGEFLALSQDVVIEAPVFAVQAPQAGDRITGVTAATGMAVGTAWRPRRAEPELATVSQGALAEKSLLNDALTLRAQLSAQSMSGTAQQKAILGAHLALLDDEELIETARGAIDSGATAAQGWRKTLWAQAEALRQLPDPRFAERAGDLMDLELRLQWQLVGGEPEAPLPPHGAILIAEDLMPSEVAALDLSRVVGLATARGGPTSHVAIIASSRGLPAWWPWAKACC
jgi:phosphocarrier protein FPr/phosphocarrier protein